MENKRKNRKRFLSAEEIAEQYPVWAIELALFIKKKYGKKK